MPYQERPTFGRYGRKWHDGKAPDGFTVNGWRRVNKGGYVRFSGVRHYHESFVEFVGMWIFIELADPWGIDVIAWIEKPWEDSGKRLYCMNEKDWMESESVNEIKEQA